MEYIFHVWRNLYRYLILGATLLLIYIIIRLTCQDKFESYVNTVQNRLKSIDGFEQSNPDKFLNLLKTRKSSENTNTPRDSKKFEDTYQPPPQNLEPKGPSQSKSLNDTKSQRRLSDNFSDCKILNPFRLPSYLSHWSPDEFMNLPKIKQKEEMCRNIFEVIYGVPFPNVRPDFLKNPETGRNLELDGYNEELGIAFEYQGPQHYTERNPWNKDQSMVPQFRRDEFKKEVCRRVGIYLIRIPYTVTPNNLPSYIWKRIPESRTLRCTQYWGFI